MIIDCPFSEELPLLRQMLSLREVLPSSDRTWYHPAITAQVTMGAHTSHLIPLTDGSLQIIYCYDILSVEKING